MNASVSLKLPRFAFDVLLSLATSTIAVAFLAGCSSGMEMVNPPAPAGNTQVAVLLTSTANDQLAVFYLSIATITLTNAAGTSVTVYSNPIQPSGPGPNGCA
jgi:hypothetical protein